MPFLMLDGVIQSANKKIDDSRPCEWCGVDVPESEYRLVMAFSDDERPYGAAKAAVVTRLCQECIEIYAALGTDGIRELPGD